MEQQTRSRLRAGLDPRRPIQRDPFNEYFVFILSAVGASVVVPIVLLLVAVLVGELHVAIFLAAAAVLELVLIFVVGRPQMKPHERVGWAVLWGATAVALGACFYYLVVDNLV